MTPRIHLVFKTHLDIGFTDHEEKVRRLYHERFIPQAIATGEHFHAEDPENPKFIWTTGAWLIWDHLETGSRQEVARLEKAIEKGIIRWHGLPFTTHSELMSPALFRAGLSSSAELDRRFGKRTIAAKMTDVPGHTLGIVPPMAEAGIKFLHIGVNSASPPPEVPEIFRWRAPGGAEVVVMYQRSYGATHLPEGLSHGLSFAHTNDNLGPQQIHQVVEILREMRHRHPDAEIRAATLEDYGAILWENRERFPVVDIELGDSWIHGAASDPVKLSRFRALQRLYDAFETEGLTPSRRAFGRGLTLVAEHTCGVDVKTFLRDETAWDRPAFEAMRKTDFRFRYTETSWVEQRAYLDRAVEALAGEDRHRAELALAETVTPPAAGLTQEEAPTGTLIAGDVQVEIDRESGDILALTFGGRRIAGDGPLFGYRYESYDAADMARHLDSYLTHRPEWAILDHGKPGLNGARTARSAGFTPRLAGVLREEGRLVIAMLCPEEAHATLGAPRRVDYVVMPCAGGVEIAVVLRDKPANRMPEAGFLALSPKGARDWRFLKTGLWLEAARVAPKGGGALQAIFAARAELGGGLITIEPLDSAVAGPLGHPFMEFPEVPPAYRTGLAFNLHNNKWGTNFPMWWEGDFASRFRIAVQG
jgi:hypothetical protein